MKVRESKIIFVRAPVESSPTLNLALCAHLYKVLTYKKRQSSFQGVMQSAHRWKSAFDTFVCYSLLKHSNQITESKVITCRDTLKGKMIVNGDITDTIGSLQHISN